MIRERLSAPAAPVGYAGHAHFWDRAMSRGVMLKTAAAGVGATMVLPALAKGASNSTLPKHIPGGVQPFGPGTQVFHVFLPGPDAEPATIFNFRGDVGVAALNGMGTH